MLLYFLHIDNAPSTEPDTEDQERNQTSDEKLICDNGPPDLEDMLDYYTAKEILGDVSSHSQEKENRAHMSPEAICSQSQIRLGEEPNQSDEEASGTQPLSLNNFTLLKMLGKGAYGSVVLARDNIRKEEVALKVVDKSELLKDDSGLVEHQILQLSHQSPYLIHGPAAFQTLSAIFFVLEYAPRGDLQDFLQKNFPLAKDTVQFIMAELICGVQFLHNIGAIHRDLKLPNILLASDGHIKITDFGVTQMNVYDNIGQWGFAGTPAYLAPEMFLGEAYGRGVDYFAIGVILYKLLQFHPPFTGSSLEEIALSIIYDRPHFPDNMPYYTMDIIERLLCKNQFQRLGVNGNVTEHPYFSNVIWEDIQLKRVKPPAVMTAEEDERTGAASPKADEFEKNKELFQNFSYVGPAWEQQYHP
ncbi:Protein kinase C, partial [Pristimantis euphronides]